MTALHSEVILSPVLLFFSRIAALLVVELNIID